MNKIGIYSSRSFEKPYLAEANNNRFELIFLSEALSAKTVELCKGCTGIAVFTSDQVSAEVLELLKAQGIQFIAARSTGYDHIDIEKANSLQIRVANVPAYSPNAIAEHAVALMLALSRHLVLSNEKVNRFDFSIDDLAGFNLQSATIGIVGTGSIGAATCKILLGFGARLLAYDVAPDNRLAGMGIEYVSFKTLCSESDVISMHVPLNESTVFMINAASIGWMKKGVMLINTSRGKLVNTKDVIQAIDEGKIGYFGTDVYENEKGIFFYDHSVNGIQDDVLKTLIGRKNVIVTAHHAFLTKEALQKIAEVTLANIECFTNSHACPNEISWARPKMITKQETFRSQ